MRFTIPLTLLLSVLALGADAAKKDAEEMQGTWSVEEFTESGDKMEIPDDLCVVIKDNGFEVKLGDKAGEPKVALKLNDSKKVKEVDFVDDQERLVYAGVYEINDDHLRLCYSTKGQRPKGFASEKDSGVRLLVLKRQAK